MALSKDTIAKLTDYRNIFKEINTVVFEREAEIDGLERAVMSASHIMLIGPPGTSKTNMMDIFAGAVEDDVTEYFLCHAFMTPEELFGPLSLKGLQDDKFIRLVGTEKDQEPYAPVCDFLELDEVMDASSQMLRSMNSLLNERRYRSGGTKVKSPLITAMGMTNKTPDAKDQKLEAFWDRWMQRFVVQYLKTDDAFNSMIEDSASGRRKGLIKERVTSRIKLDDLNDLIGEAKEIKWRREITIALNKIRAELRQAGIVPSDRKYAECTAIIKASALLREADEVEVVDLLPLINILWVYPNQQPKVVEVLSKYASTVKNEVQEALKEAQEIWHRFDKLTKGGADQTRIHASAFTESVKIKKILARLDKLKAATTSEQPLLDNAKKQVRTWRGEMEKALGLDDETDSDDEDDAKPVKKGV